LKNKKVVVSENSGAKSYLKHEFYVSHASVKKLFKWDERHHRGSNART